MSGIFLFIHRIQTDAQFRLGIVFSFVRSEPRLAFNRIVVSRYPTYLELRGLAANTINQQLADVRHLAHEAAAAGLLSPKLVAGISRVKGCKTTWLSYRELVERGRECSEILRNALGTNLRAKRDSASWEVMLGCGLRRSELVGLEARETCGFAVPRLNAQWHNGNNSCSFSGR